jgi:hypothetical protein
VIISARDILPEFPRSDYTEKEIKYIEFCQRFHSDSVFAECVLSDPAKEILAAGIGTMEYLRAKKVEVFVDVPEKRHINIPWPFIRSFDDRYTVNEILSHIADTVSGHTPDSTGTGTASVGTCIK